MNPLRSNLTPSQAAARLGISAKTLRIYEGKGLVGPGRSAAGWRCYAPEDLERAAQVLALRALGLSLAEVARVLDGDAKILGEALAAHEAELKRRIRQLGLAVGEVRRLRAAALDGQAPTAAALGGASGGLPPVAVGFALPWPWDGERFELRGIGPLSFTTGPLGSGKTRFAMRLAEALPDAAFLGLDRPVEAARRRLGEDAGLAARVERALRWLAEDGVERSDALVALVTALEGCTSACLVVDMVEQGLNAAAQEALIPFLRTRVGTRPRLFLMTRSSAILDLDAVGPDEAVVVCPANHGLPFRASTVAGGRGRETAASCLATPDVRARTAGVWAAGPLTA